jgi:hypothetical protein
VTPSDALGKLLAERACEHLILEYVRRLDLGDPASVADLFTSEGAWEWPDGGRHIEGREALRVYFGNRPAGRLSRRIMTNIMVEILSATNATATSYLTTYRVDGYTGGMIAPRLPTNVGHYEDGFQKIDGVWLFASRRVFLPFGTETERLTQSSTHSAPVEGSGESPT